MSTPCPIRTGDRRIRSPVLYPAELRGRGLELITSKSRCSRLSYDGAEFGADWYRISTALWSGSFENGEYPGAILIS